MEIAETIFKRFTQGEIGFQLRMLCVVYIVRSKINPALSWDLPSEVLRASICCGGFVPIRSDNSPDLDASCLWFCVVGAMMRDGAKSSVPVFFIFDLCQKITKLE